MRQGAIISGAVHGAVILAAVIGLDFVSPEETAPIAITDVTMIDGRQFDAALSQAPSAPAEAPDPLALPGADAAPAPIAEADLAPERSDAATLVTAPTPEARPDRPEIASPPPPTAVPTEAPRPSIAEIPSPDVMPRQAAEPESPPSTEPLQPLASAEAPAPGGRPERPPDPEPEPTPEPVSEEAPEAELEIAEDAPAETQPEGEIAAAPQEARLPVARPAEVAAAAQASRETAPPEPSTAEPEAAPATRETAPAGTAPTRFAAIVTPGERDALRLGIRQYFVFNGNRTDPSLSVRLGIELDQTGRIVAGPDLITAHGAPASAREALYQAGRRALLRAQIAGEFAKLPPAKYEAWRRIHVTFTPEDIGFQS